MKHTHTFFAVLAVLAALSVDPADAQDEPALLSPAALPEAMRIKSDTGVARDFALPSGEQDCAPDEPDSVQISWTAPCDGDGWLFATETGCRMWDWHPAADDKPTWTGACLAGLKEGHGVAQWFEHGEAIDRFAGTYHLNRRQGFGFYVWNEANWYEGNYQDDGCLKKGEMVVAIGVPRSSCVESPGWKSRSRSNFTRPGSGCRTVIERAPNVRP